MRNILTQPMTAEDMAALLRQSPPLPILPPRGGNEWADIAARPALQPWIADLRAQVQAERDTPTPELTDELYARFHADGSRLPFEQPYFERRQREARATLAALLFPDESAWPAEAARLLRVILAETSWALPAHVPDLSGKDPGIIDLVSSETAETLAATIALLGDALPSDLREAIRERVQAQTETFLTAYATSAAPGFDWTRAPMNWNAVCHQGVAGAALLSETDPDTLARVLAQAADGLTAFVGSFGADGGSSEGPGYWGYGFGRFVWLNEQIETFTNRRLSLMEGDAHLREIAAFARRMAAEGGLWINFSDCGAHGFPDPALSAYLGARLHDPANQRQARESYRQALAGNTGPGNGRLFDLLRFLRFCPADVPPEDHAPAEDWRFPDLQVLTAHEQDSAGRHRAVFAAKGGHNAEHHNHNDCGSFVYYLNGIAFAVEIGSPEYVKAFFGPDRYTFFAARSLGHSVPRINNCEQGAGAQFAARVLEHALTADRASLTLDLTACYPPEAACSQAQRTLVFHKTDLSLAVTDQFTLSSAQSLETALITDAAVTLSADGSALLSKDGLQVRLRPGPDTLPPRIETHSYSGHAGQPQTVSRLVLSPRLLTPQVTLRYLLTPAEIEGDILPGCD